MVTPAIRHPLLQNPLKWLRTQRHHTSELYQAEKFPSIENNPFARGLSATKMDGQKLRFPLGNSVRLVLKSTPETLSPETPSLHKTYTLIPSTGKQQNGTLLPAAYVLKNKRYVDHLLDQKSKFWQRYVPSKFRFNNDKALAQKPQICADVLGAIFAQYRSRIVSGMKAAVIEKPSGRRGMFLLSEGPVLAVEKGVPAVCVGQWISAEELGISEKVFLPYDDNAGLCEDILSVVSFFR